MESTSPQISSESFPSSAYQKHSIKGAFWYAAKPIEKMTVHQTQIPPSRSNNLYNLKMTCNFCKENGEAIEEWSSHRLKSKDGRAECPILRSLRCGACGATGDNAHTRSYCPYKDNTLFTGVLGENYFANMKLLKKTRYSASGERSNKPSNDTEPDIMKRIGMFSLIQLNDESEDLV